MLGLLYQPSQGIAMASVTLKISESQLKKLEELAGLYGLSPETLLIENLDNWLNVTNSEFADAADYVVNKNSELYRRLA